MRRRPSLATTTMIALLLALLAPTVYGAAIDVPARDGWYRWETTATATTAKACCNNWRNGVVTHCTCDLDDPNRRSNIASIAVGDDRKIRVYVRISGGVPSRIQALDAACPVTTETAIEDLGVVDAADSINWLVTRLQPDSKNVKSAIDAIALHGGEASFGALVSVLENRTYARNLREHALFWLATSDTDQAFDYLDRLLSRR